MLCLNILLMKNRQVVQENVISVQWGPWKEVPRVFARWRIDQYWPARLMQGVANPLHLQQSPWSLFLFHFCCFGEFGKDASSFDPGDWGLAQKRQSNPGWHGSPEGHSGTLAAKWCRCIEQCLWYGGVSRKQTESIVWSSIAIHYTIYVIIFIDIRESNRYIIYPHISCYQSYSNAFLFVFV